MRNNNPILLLGYAMLVDSLPIGTHLAAQQVIPVRELSSPEVKSSEHFGNIFSVRSLTGGGVLVNDGVRRQLVTLDSSFRNRTVVLDSVLVRGDSYGPMAAPLIPYLADSSLFVAGESLSLLLIDASGKVVRTMSAPKPRDLRFMAGSASASDMRGNLLYRTSSSSITSNSGATAPSASALSDSATIVRANFETRQVDSVGRLKQNMIRVSTTIGPNDKVIMTLTINPLAMIDEWAVLSDGTIAFVRGRDYHIDWIKSDGTKSSSPKMPFDWKRVTSESKQALIDSTRIRLESALAKSETPTSFTTALKIAASLDPAVIVEFSSRSTPSSGGTGLAPVAKALAPRFAFAELNEIADYYPPVRSGAAKADLDGNLWILPTTSVQSKAGELVYDVVNSRNGLFQRVRLPKDRSIVGFGPKGTVYLAYRDSTSGWVLERTKVLTPSAVSRRPLS